MATDLVHRSQINSAICPRLQVYYRCPSQIHFLGWINVLATPPTNHKFTTLLNAEVYPPEYTRLLGIIQLNIEIVTTPNDCLKETGMGTANACNSIMEALGRSGRNATVTVCETMDDLEKICARKPDIVMLAAKYINLKNGKTIWLSSYFESHSIFYTGSGRNELLFDSNKVTAKELVRARGIQTAKFFLALPGDYTELDELPLPYPLFVKPLSAANGNGIDSDSVVSNFREYQAKVEALSETYCEPALVEDYLNGREFTVSIIQGSRDLVLAPIEIVPPIVEGRRILSAKTKTLNNEKLAEITRTGTLLEVAEMARKSFLAIGARDYARIDIKMDNHGTCHFMEANLVPGMTPRSSYFPLAFEIHSGFSYDEVVRLIIQSAINRKKQDTASIPTKPAQVHECGPRGPIGLNAQLLPPTETITPT